MRAKLATMQKEALLGQLAQGAKAVGQGFKGLGQAAKAGYGGVSQGKAIAGGLKGGATGATNYMKHIAKKNPALAAGMAGTAAVPVAAGTGYALGS
jgi:hypothetical protein